MNSIKDLYAHQAMFMLRLSMSEFTEVVPVHMAEEAAKQVEEKASTIGLNIRITVYKTTYVRYRNQIYYVLNYSGFSKRIRSLRIANQYKKKHLTYYIEAFDENAKHRFTMCISAFHKHL